MRHKIVHLLFDNLWLKFLSLAVAFFIWLFVSNINDPIRSKLFNNVPITLINEDTVADIGKVVMTEGTGTVTLKVTERRSVLDSLKSNGENFKVEANIENINEFSSVPLTVSCSNSYVTWDEIEISPSSLKVNLENKVEQTFVISVSVEGSPAGGYEVGQYSVQEGRNIVLAGPESLMSIVNQVVAPVNVNGLSEDTTRASVLRIYDRNGAMFTDSQLSRLEFKDESGVVIEEHMVNVDVDLWKVRTDIPLAVHTSGTPAWGYRVSEIKTIPASISVAGTDEALAGIGTAFEVSDAIDVSGANESISTEIDLTDTFQSLEGLKLIADIDPVVQVNVQIEQNGDVTLGIPLSAITLENRPDNMTLVFTPADLLQVSVHALDSSARKLNAEDLTVKLDLSQCAEEGSYELPVEVELPEGYELASDVTIKVSAAKVERTSEAEQVPHA